MKRRFRGAAALAVASILLMTVGGGVRATSRIVTLTWSGLRGDLVSAGDPTDNSSWNTPDGITDGTFVLTVLAPAGTVHSLDLNKLNNGGGEWDTISGNGTWGLGVTRGKTGNLVNDPSTSGVTIDITKSGKLRVTLHADDDANSTNFVSTTQFTLTACFDAALTDCVVSNTVTIP